MDSGSLRLGNSKSHWKSISLDNVKQSLAIVENAAQAAGLKIDSSTSLGKCLSKVRDYILYKEVKLIKFDVPNSESDLIMSCVRECQVLSEAIEWLGSQPQFEKRLKTLLKESVDPRVRSRNRAKDLLLEVKMLQYLKRAQIECNFAEPDIVFRFANEQIGIACKCLYSESNVDTQIRKACNQISGSGIKGIMALDISALCDSSILLSAVDEVQFQIEISAVARNFIDQHERILKNRFKPMVIGIMVHTQTYVTFQSERAHNTAAFLLTMNFHDRESSETKLLKSVELALRPHVK